MSDLVIYWRGSAEVRADILAAMMGQGHQIRSVRTFEELLDRLVKEKEDPILVIVDASGGKQEALDRITELSTANPIFNLSILFVGPQASERAAGLEKKYAKIQLIDMPYTPETIEEKIAALVPGFVVNQIAEEQVAEKSETDSPPISLSEVRDAVVEADLARVSKDGAEGGLSLSSSGRRRIVYDRRDLSEYRDPSNLKGSYGGKVFAIARELHEFDDKILLGDCKNSKTAQQALKRISELDEELGIHARRVSFMSCAVASNLSFGKEREKVVKLAGLFLNCAASEVDLTVLCHDLIQCPNDEMKIAMGDAFQKSARVAKKVLHKQFDVVKTIRAVGALVRGDELWESKEILENAKCVLAVELVSRSCWGIGYWNPYGAYRAMKHLRSKASMVDDKTVAGSVVRVLGEAVTDHVTVRNVFIAHPEAEEERALNGVSKAATNGTTAAAALQSIDSQAQRVIEISNLIPGMRLAEPVYSLDGRLVLDAQIELNEEIVFHLWQLAARKSNPQ